MYLSCEIAPHSHFSWHDWPLASLAQASWGIWPTIGSYCLGDWNLCYGDHCCCWFVLDWHHLHRRCHHHCHCCCCCHRPLWPRHRCRPAAREKVATFWFAYCWLVWSWSTCTKLQFSFRFDPKDSVHSDDPPIELYILAKELRRAQETRPGLVVGVWVVARVATQKQHTSSD